MHEKGERSARERAELARELFELHVPSMIAGEDGALERLCAEHPDLREELQTLREHWMRIEDHFAELGAVRAQRSSSDPAEGSSPPAAGSVIETEERDDVVPHARLIVRLASVRRPYERYSAKEELAHGGMAVVYSVWDEDLRRRLAMKVIGPRAQGGPRAPDVVALGRFLDEAQVTAQLDHPGITPIHELGLTAEGRAYFTMKLVEGVTLSEILRSLAEGADGWNRTRVLGVILRVCEAMSYAHDRGVLHRDLKPSNVMVGRYGESTSWIGGWRRS